MARVIAPYVDDLAGVHEFGSVTHLLFAILRREVDGTSPHRVVVQRLVIPTTLRADIARQLLATGECGEFRLADGTPPLH